MASNNIGNPGAQYILQMLNKNKTLTSVDIRDNNLHEELGPDICEALNEIPENSLRYLVFSGLELGRTAVGQAEHAARRMNISLVTNESNLHFPQLDRDDDPMKKVRDLEAKVKKKNEEMSKRSKFVLYNDEFAYCCRKCAIEDNFSLCAEDIRLQFIEALANEDNNELNRLFETYEDPPLDAHEAKADTLGKKKKTKILSATRMPG